MATTTTATLAGTTAAAGAATAALRGRRGAAITHPPSTKGAYRSQQKRPQHRQLLHTFHPHTDDIDARPRRQLTAEPAELETPWWLSSDAEHAHTACPLRPFAHMVIAMEKSTAVSSDAGDCSSSINIHAQREHDDGWADSAYADPGARRREQSACTTQPPITAERLKASRIVHLSDALRRKLNSVTSARALGGTVGDILQLSSRARSSANHSSARMRSGLWSMLGWLVGAHESPARCAHPQAHVHMHNPCITGPESPAADPRAQWPRRRQEHALAPEDDPLYVGNEGLGAVELASVRAGKSGCVFALCAHALSTDVQGEWLEWQASPKRPCSAQQSTATADPRLSAAGLGDMQLAIVHVAEVSTLHRVACNGIDFLMPPPLPLDQYFGHMLDSSRQLGPPPMLPPLLKPEAGECDVDADIRWISLLVSRHGLVEMAYPLGRTPIVPAADADSNDPALETCPPVALGSYLGESIFSRIHPEDVVRVVKALRLAWDTRPDVYHFSRLRREWQRRRLSSAGDRAVASAPSTPPLRPHRAATMSAASAGGRHALHPTNRHVYHQEGIEVSNGVVELNVQIQLTGSATVDWSDSDSMSEHTRFARMKLTRWPLILRPPRVSSAAYRAGGYQHLPEPEEPQDGFVLVGLRPLPEPSRTRSRSTADAYDLMPDLKKLSISSATSVSTLVGIGVGGGHGATSSHGSAELVRLCRSSSSLSCQETTARPSIEFSDAIVRTGSQQRSPPSSSGSNGSSRGRGSGGNLSRGGVDAGWPSNVAIPTARPIVGLSNNAVQTATGMSPHLTMRRRSNITVGSQRNNAEEGLASLVYGAQCEFSY
ncbi:hypothetical protein IW140_002527 [Coemansia sp. RSA 1813]|nr:hypothetical protein EV178_001902 [Coemansia sp. RSA 1646]KAJ1769631.1 hypothetical protein LPJ74_003880 [Coemansia sp. RSA 1843]KAJ2090996.1 hypothetical protein IW138_002190 [Coemansia sp. RSA 986]KAJ2215907.1 hypothetical protein EV179_001735 [Coemansia sp. RSA 487]KAJ2570251.1 hypothetical protein IW140_002527 [Coemansia sp. RSA 1813]